MPYPKAQMETQIILGISRVKNGIYTVKGDLSITAWVTPEPVPFNIRKSGEKKELTVGAQWGRLWDCAWFHFSGKVPPDTTGKKVVLLIDVGGEACIVDQNGSPVEGLTNRNSEFDRSLGESGKQVFFLLEKAKGGESIDIWADAGSNDLFGKYRDQGKVKAAYIAICDDQLKTLYYDLQFLYELMQSLSQNDARHDSILFTLYDAVMMLNSIIPEVIVKVQEKIRNELAKKSGDASLFINALGHSHIDLAWLWPLRETIRKGERTFATALTMMERYPDYIFGASQPQLYQWMKVYYPELYRKIDFRVKEGRWETLGAMWVEADTNLPGGESLVRQILYGKRFFQKEFGQSVNILWLPDSFGYSAALPQILKKSGVDYFCTTKLAWNLYNRFPHHTFKWVGIDGSSVLAHMPPEGTYNSSARPGAVLKTEANYIDKGISRQCMMLFGIGDGGGGPGEEHLEMLKREHNVAGLPPVRQKKAIEFFRELAQNISQYQNWQGELYLERHQGTYTSQARNKRFNRKMEIAIHDLEFCAAVAMILAKASYPADEIETIWKEVLLYQFHDILPGSAITRVYRESLARYEVLLKWVTKLKSQAISIFASRVNSSNACIPALILNSTSLDRKEWLKIDCKWYWIQVPAMGYRVIDLGIPTELPTGMVVSQETMENDQLRIEWANDGSIASLFDKANRCEILAPEICGNRLAVYQDNGDAWDIPIGYADRVPEYFQLVAADQNIDGPKVSVKHRYTYGNSLLEQEIILVHGNRRIDFITRVDWREHNKMLRVAFPLNIRSHEATCEIQFGSIRRPTNRNTSWEMAKFEICAHKWVDLSETGYGVALLNDCKYGYKVYPNLIDINLLRSPVYPDSNADQGIHDFIYALYPHPGDHIQGKVIQQGYELNYPLSAVRLSRHKGVLPISASILTVEPENIIVETIKKAEDSSSIVIRLYESSGRATVAKLDIHLPFESVEMVNLMEEHSSSIKSKPQVVLEFNPFEIHTLKLNYF